MAITTESLHVLLLLYWKVLAIKRAKILSLNLNQSKYTIKWGRTTRMYDF